MRWKIKQIVQPLKGKLAKNINKGLKINGWVERDLLEKQKGW